jgi:hypothetical protein
MQLTIAKPSTSLKCFVAAPAAKRSLHVVRCQMRQGDAVRQVAMNVAIAAAALTLTLVRIKRTG